MRLVIPKKDFTLSQSAYYWSFTRPANAARETGKAYSIGSDEIYVLTDDAAHTHKQMFNLARVELTNKKPDRGVVPDKAYIPPDWNIKEALASSSPRIYLLIMHGTGSGYGDIISGVYAVDRLKEKFRKAGKRLYVCALTRETAMDNYYTVCRIRDSFDEIRPFAMRLHELTRFDYILGTESLLAEKEFQTLNFYDYWLQKMGLNPDEEPKCATLAPSPKVMEYMRERCAGIREELGPGDPLCVLNVHATRLRCIPAHVRTKLAEEMAKDYRLVLVSNASDQGDLYDWVRSMPESLKARCFDASPLTCMGWDYLTGALLYLADVVVTPDTGLLHLAGLLGVPTAAIFFTIEPELRTRYMPRVLSYVAPEWREGPYWGESKARGQEQLAIIERLNRKDMSDDYLEMWRAFKPEEIRRLASEAVKTEPVKPALTGYVKRKHPRIAVYGFDTMTHYFEDRLANTLIPHVVPSDAQVDYFQWRPYDYIPLARYDLVIFGSGGGLIGPVIEQPGLIELLRAAKHSIGIFGLELRESIDLGHLKSLVDALEHWYARTTDDLEFAERPENASMFGLWQMILWPMSDWRLDGTAVINEQARSPHAIDHAIRDIPASRRIASHHLSCLLCGLTGAEEVQYEESFHGDKKVPVGAFQPALQDVLGKSYQAKRWIKVDRAKVANYKREQDLRVKKLRDEIARMVG